MGNELKILSFKPTDKCGISEYRNNIQTHKLAEQMPEVDSLFAKESPYYITHTHKFEFDMVVETKLPMSEVTNILRIMFANYLALNGVVNPTNLNVISCGDRKLPYGQYPLIISHMFTSGKPDSEFAEKVLDDRAIQLHIAQTMHLVKLLFTHLDYYKATIGMLFRMHEAQVGAQQQFVNSMTDIGVPELAEKYKVPDIAQVLSDDLDLLFGLGRYHKSITLYVAGVVNRFVK